MSLAQRLANASPRGQGLPCPIAVAMRKLDREDAEALRSVLEVAMGAPGWLSSPAILEELEAEGFNMHVSSVQKHRRRQCRCYHGSPK